MKGRIVFSNKMIVGVIVTSIILFSLSLETKTATSPSNSLQIMKTNDQVAENPISFDLTPHDPIEIDSDSDFITYSFPGSGTEIDPYIIENYEIISSSYYGIEIYDTSKFFVIRDCYVDARGYGINIENVADGTTSIINNTCTNNDYGIRLSSSSGSSLINNNCSNNNYYGIYLTSSSNSTFTDNTCNNNYYGIHLKYSSGSSLTDNTCNNNYYSICLDSSSGSSLTNNTCTNNNYYGIYLFSSDSCVVTYNLLQENERYGFSFSFGSDNNIIHHNIFIFNNLGGTSQAKDDGLTNTWYNNSTNKGNYWSDWSGSGSYSIEGFTGASDPYPLSHEDTDSDGLADIFEIIVYHTNPSLNDTDGDGLSDGEEVNIYKTDPNNTDTDGDGLEDGEEVNTYGTDPNNVDSDGDDYSDFEEINAGKNPLDPNSHPLSVTARIIFFTVLPILATVAILAFVVPKYVVPYARNTIIPRITALWSEKKTRGRKQIQPEKVVRTPVIVLPQPTEQISKDFNEVPVSKDEDVLIYCSSCGEKVNKSLKFCQYCGTTFEE